MDKIWDRKSFEVGGHWPLWRDEKNELPRITDKSNAKKKQKTICNVLVCSSVVTGQYSYTITLTILYIKYRHRECSEFHMEAI